MQSNFASYSLILFVLSNTAKYRQNVGRALSEFLRPKEQPVER